MQGPNIDWMWTYESLSQIDAVLGDTVVTTVSMSYKSIFASKNEEISDIKSYGGCKNNMG